MLPSFFPIGCLSFPPSWQEGVQGTQSNCDYVLQGGRVSPGFVDHVDSLRHPDKETGQRPTILSAGQRARSLRAVQDMIQRRLLLSQPFSNRATDSIAAPRAFQRGIGIKAAARPTGITRALEKHGKHPLNGTPRVRIP